jgi:hypothetical protein
VSLSATGPTATISTPSIVTAGSSRARPFPPPIDRPPRKRPEQDSIFALRFTLRLDVTALIVLAPGFVEASQTVPIRIASRAPLAMDSMAVKVHTVRAGAKARVRSKVWADATIRISPDRLEAEEMALLGIGRG